MFGKFKKFPKNKNWQGLCTNHLSVAHCLASIGDIKGLGLLKSKGGSFAIKSNSGTYALHEAALAGHSGKWRTDHVPISYQSHTNHIPIMKSVTVKIASQSLVVT